VNKVNPEETDSEKILSDPTESNMAGHDETGNATKQIGESTSFPRNRRSSESENISPFAMNNLLPQIRQFQHLNQQNFPLKPVQNWSPKQWRDVLDTGGKEARRLLKALGLEDTGGLDTGSTIQQRMSGGLTDDQWCAIVRVQHTSVSDDALHMEDKNSSDDRQYYMSTDLIANTLFNREFPLGVDPKRLDKEKRWKFSIHHSGSSIAHHKESRTVDILVWAALIILVIMAIIFLLYNSAKTSLWCLECTNQTVAANKITLRTQERGTVASILSALTFSLFINASLVGS
jgi:hypothetical protein